MGAVTILLAALLLCLTAYYEQWGQHLANSSSVDSSAPAPNTEDPSYFEDKDIPRVFEEYATLHNSATASPMNAKYVLYEMPGNTTLAHSLFGLVRRGGKCDKPSLAVAPNQIVRRCYVLLISYDSISVFPMICNVNLEPKQYGTHLTSLSKLVDFSGIQHEYANAPHPSAPQSSMSMKTVAV